MSTIIGFLSADNCSIALAILLCVRLHPILVAPAMLVITYYGKTDSGNRVLCLVLGRVMGGTVWFSSVLPGGVVRY